MLIGSRSNDASWRQSATRRPTRRRCACLASLSHAQRTSRIDHRPPGERESTVIRAPLTFALSIRLFNSRIRCRTARFCTKTACSSSSSVARPRPCGCCCTIGSNDREPTEIIAFDRDTDRWGDIWSIFVPGHRRRAALSLPGRRPVRSGAWPAVRRPGAADRSVCQGAGRAIFCPATTASFGRPSAW